MDGWVPIERSSSVTDRRAHGTAPRSTRHARLVPINSLGWFPRTTTSPANRGGTGGSMTDARLLQPGFTPVVGRACVAQRHRVAVFVATAPDAAHQGAQPRSEIDAVDGTAAMPLRLLGQHQILEIEIGV